MLEVRTAVQNTLFTTQEVRVTPLDDNKIVKLKDRFDTFGVLYGVELKTTLRPWITIFNSKKSQVTTLKFVGRGTYWATQCGKRCKCSKTLNIINNLVNEAIKPKGPDVQYWRDFSDIAEAYFKHK